MLKFKSREVWKLLTIAGENICHRPFNYSFIYSKSIYGFPSSCAWCALHSNKLLTWQIKQIIQQRFLFFISSIFSTFCALHWQLPIGYWGQCQWENQKKKQGKWYSNRSCAMIYLLKKVKNFVCLVNIIIYFRTKGLPSSITARFVLACNQIIIIN